jgi:hypothetical protein
MPLYGRAFETTEGIGMAFSGVGNGTWEAGVYDFDVLPMNGAKEIYDGPTGSSYSYDSIKRELVSYDTITVAKQKATWIQQMGLGGAMWWESSADRLGEESLIWNVVEVLGGGNGSGLDNMTNQLQYPNSTYDNIRKGYPELGSISPTRTPSSVYSSNASTSTGAIASYSFSIATELSVWTTTATFLYNTTFTSCLRVTIQSTSTIYLSSVTTTSKSLSSLETSITQTAPFSSSASSSKSSSLLEANYTTRSTSTMPFSSASSILTSLSSLGTSSATRNISTTAPSNYNTTQVIYLNTLRSPTPSGTKPILIPGENGVPGCAYILAKGLEDAACENDYCNCGGTIAPLLNGTSSGTHIYNCNYSTQPSTNFCNNHDTTVTDEVLIIPGTVIVSFCSRSKSVVACTTVTGQATTITSQI